MERFRGDETKGYSIYYYDNKIRAEKEYAFAVAVVSTRQDEKPYITGSTLQKQATNIYVDTEKISILYLFPCSKPNLKIAND